MKNKILFATVIFSILFFSKIAFSLLPPHPIITTSITTPSQSGVSEKVLEIAFSINQTNQITLQSISIKNLPQAIINPTKSDFKLEITDANNKVLYQSNILAVFDSKTNLSQEYYAIPYPAGAKYLYFFYQGNQIARFDVPQEFPWLYVLIGVAAVAIVLIVYFISRKYMIQI